MKHTNQSLLCPLKRNWLDCQLPAHLPVLIQLLPPHELATTCKTKRWSNRCWAQQRLSSKFRSSKASWKSNDHINGILARLVSGTTMVETFFQKPSFVVETAQLATTLTCTGATHPCPSTQHTYVTVAQVNSHSAFSLTSSQTAL